MGEFIDFTRNVTIIKINQTLFHEHEMKNITIGHHKKSISLIY